MCKETNARTAVRIFRMRTTEQDKQEPSGHQIPLDLSEYQRPSTGRSIWQLTNSLIPYIALMWFAIWAFDYSYWLSLPAIILATGFLIRLFIIFHDCGHGSFFANQKVNNAVGRFMGLLTFAPFTYWNKSHARHHATSANLDKRGHGDVWMMTIEEYRAAPWKEKVTYRLYRNPVVMFLLGPIFIIFISNRVVRRKVDIRERRSVYLSNLGILVFCGVMSYLVGWKQFLFVQFPVVYLSTVIGVWLFYVQHQFEGVYWARQEEWDFQTASIDGGSFYALPRILHWFTGNIGYHHIHHLNSRIPNYYLPKAHRQAEPLLTVPGIGIRKSMKSLTYRLWDETQNRLVGFRRAKATSGR
jgi:acyl-lipid omega-6 desaturase (Delta-12 desaturase)